ncbi:lysosomal membrane ascorbate-dependent ferrireductase CYB561A3 isoform X1 [Gracilinanus agilis]|uniref:lysosomal membrane ascorbate-dependent ferrireductase CYB561A3 isoform X1 n=1 Tax=Gracilinanus agilis TaxID=191870 RepID=UPI001CFDDBDD|nr:lysosomal membrane ascorbate-dependent ferrireductase CYB561A3 isoform X1 [Gracilinanus agilis]
MGGTWGERNFPSLGLSFLVCKMRGLSRGVPFSSKGSRAPSVPSALSSARLLPSGRRRLRGGGRALASGLPAASLVYRLPQAWLGPKLPWKLLHAALHLAAFVLTVLGLVAVFDFHRHSHIAHLYSLHSWLGITAVALFACQWFLGFTIFLLPWASLWLRSLLKPLHVFFGATILALSMASVVSGINEKLFFSLKNVTAPYSSLPPEARFANATGMLVLLFGVCVLYVLLASSWKRPEPGLLSDRQPLLQEGE